MDNFRNLIITKIWFGHKLNKSHFWTCQKVRFEGKCHMSKLVWKKKFDNNDYNYPIVFLIFFYK